MGTTRRKKATLFEQRIDIIKKLRDMGIKTEKGLHTLSLEQLLNDDGSITADELRDILQVKQQIKAGTLFSWLCENVDQEPAAPAEPEEQEANHEYQRYI